MYILRGISPKHRRVVLDASCQEAHDMSLHPDFGDPSFGHPAKVVSARFIYYRVTTFSFIINKQFESI